MSRFFRRRVLWVTLACLVSAPVVLHLTVRRFARIEPPAVNVPAGQFIERAGTRSWGRSYVVRRENLLEVHLSGSPEEIGYAHARLLHDPMVELEGVLYQRFREMVSWSMGRLLLLDLAELRFHHLDRNLGPSRQRELGAAARGFEPDPFAGFMPTFQRLVYLNSLYDIALSFEHSPLLGCTSFVLSGDLVTGGDTLLARNFDFELDEAFDRGKAVFLIREDASIPFASVSWPGLIGVVSGMNVEGVAVVAHGARAGSPSPEGEPVALELRRTLSTARNTEEAIAALSARDTMVSHLVVVADANGRAAVVERVPAERAHVRRLGERAVVTNHFEGPAAADPKNLRVRATSSTLERRRRGEELLGQLRGPVTAREAVTLLRERRGPEGVRFELGDRRAIDALIAAHGVVMNTTRRVLWVSEGPRLLGRFVSFDLGRLLGPDRPVDPEPVEALAADPLLGTEEYARWRAQQRPSAAHDWSMRQAEPRTAAGQREGDGGQGQHQHDRDWRGDAGQADQ
jgi:isopenicillin-N N-acyltransferase like protein